MNLPHIHEKQKADASLCGIVLAHWGTLNGYFPIVFSTEYARAVLRCLSQCGERCWGIAQI